MEAEIFFHGLSHGSLAFKTRAEKISQFGNEAASMAAVTLLSEEFSSYTLDVIHVCATQTSVL